MISFLICHTAQLRDFTVYGTMTFGSVGGLRSCLTFYAFLLNRVFFYLQEIVIPSQHQVLPQKSFIFGKMKSHFGCGLSAGHVLAS